jgi:hypothetical protein
MTAMLAPLFLHRKQIKRRREAGNAKRPRASNAVVSPSSLLLYVKSR